MAKPEPSWGKANASFVRYEMGRLAEEDERIESESPDVFAGKDETRATPLNKARRDKRRLPRPGKNEPEITRDEMKEIRWPKVETLNDLAYKQSVRKQLYLACRRRGHHDWRAYISEWDERRHHICADCGEIT